MADRWLSQAVVCSGLVWCGVTAAVLQAAEPQPQASRVQIDVHQEPAPLISHYNLFQDAARQIPNEGLLPYELTTPHFADYATLHRFVGMPADVSCEYGPHGEIEYPVGAVLVITIGYQADLRDPTQGEQIVETRLWMKRDTGWIGVQYIWNEDVSEARLSIVGEPAHASWIHSDGQPREYHFRVPNRNQCVQCHEIDEQLLPLGPMHARYLNRPMKYPEGDQNQLQRWVDAGFLTGLPQQAEQIPALPIWNDPSTGDVDARARAYLDMNCSSCHQKGGIAATSGLDLRWDQREPVKFGIFKAPVAAGRAAGNGRFVIEPGQPEKSILLMRLKSTDPGIRMPVVGRGLTHDEGVALITQWIAEMDYPEMAARQQQIDQQSSLLKGLAAPR